jgi:hypothetical protein
MLVVVEDFLTDHQEDPEVLVVADREQIKEQEQQVEQILAVVAEVMPVQVDQVL